MKGKFFIATALIISALSVYYLFFAEIENKDRNFTFESEEEREGNEPGFVPAMDWLERQRAFPFDEIPLEEYYKSVEYVKNNFSADLSDNSAQWNLAGPTNIEGRITTIAIHPNNPQIIYTGTANGGLWKSTNFCQSWISIFDNQNTSSIGSLAIDPVNPNIIYCGTGESNSLRSYYPGTGMYKSTDAGNTWVFAGLDSSYTIGNISINPLNTQEIYAAAGGWTRRKNIQRGIYKSTNAGQSWNKSLFIADSVGAFDVCVDPVNPAKVIAAMWEVQRREDYIKYGGPKSGLFVTTNSGDIWTPVSGGFPVNDINLGRISLDISNSNPQIIYALTATTGGTTRGLYKSTNGGTNWAVINASVAGSSNYAWFNRICRVDPVNSDKVFCGGLDMEMSTNGGTSFGIIGKSHVDQHAVAFSFSNPNYIAVGNDGGIDYSTDGGSTWLASQSLPITQFYAGDIDFNNPNTILAGTQDNGTNRTTGSIGNWEEINGGDGFYCLVDYSNSQRVYASSQMGGLVRSTDGGNTFFGGTSGLDLQYTNWMTPYVIDKNNPLTLYAGSYKIHKSTNAMASWTAISPDLAAPHIRNLGTITTVDVAKSNPNVIYCGTDNAKVWCTTNGGTNWLQVNAGLPYRWVTRVAVHPDSANVCYVTLSGYKVDSTGSHIFRTTNYGSNWISIKGNLPDAPINDVIIDPDNTNTLYIGTDITVMYSSNLGASWNILAAGIPSNVPCHDLTFHQPTRALVVWTHGRSAFKTVVPIVGVGNNISSLPDQFDLLQNYPNPFNPVTNLEFEISAFGTVSIKVYDALGKEIADLVNGKKSPGKYSVKFDGSDLPSGVYFYRMTVASQNGLIDFNEVRKMLLVK
ncbi:MAG: T9SS type A sorting domain-containing protein [bacterium]|nr:T9SS type A sorting domain-containing protein [bacterium]